MIKSGQRLGQMLVLLAALPLTLSCRDRPETVDQATDRAETARVVKAEVPGIRNFSRIGDGAGFGGATEASAMTWLGDSGFASVINLRFATEPGVDVDASRAAASAAGLKYVHLPFDAADSDPRLIEDFLAAVDDEANQPVYIHCNSATRVAALWMIKRVSVDHWEFDRAREEAEVIADKPSEAIAFASSYLGTKGN